MERFNYVTEELALPKKTNTTELKGLLSEMISEGWSKEYLFRKVATEFPDYRPRNGHGYRECLDFLVPDKFYVYKLYQSKDLVYIGSTINLGNRLKGHIVSEKEFDSVEVCEIDSKNTMLGLEHSLILKYTPLYNKDLNLSYAKGYTGNEKSFTNLLSFNPDMMVTFVNKSLGMDGIDKEGSKFVYTSKRGISYKPLSYQG